MRHVALIGLLSGCITSIDVTSPPSVTSDASAPAFKLPSHTGANVRLADLVADGPGVALVFYRGHW